MASDEIVWNIINQGFCSFKLKSIKGMNFCRNEHNVDGRCNRQSCPLANSRYATVRSNDQGVLYLYIKTIERAHLPSKLWEKIKLSANYQQALEQIDERLKYFPKYLLHKCKQRATRIFQVNTRMRRLAKEEVRLGEKLVPRMAPKIRRREETRERKAENAAKLEKTIERELIERLRQGAYGDQPLNVSETIWRKVLNALEKEGEGSRDKDLDKGIEEEEDEESEAEREIEYDEEGNLVGGQVEYVSDFDESDEELDDIEDWLASEEDDEEDDDDEEDSDEDAAKKKAKAGDKRKKGKVTRMKAKKRREVEREEELELERPRLLV